jgi:hypothetical protein
MEHCPMARFLIDCMKETRPDRLDQLRAHQDRDLTRAADRVGATRWHAAQAEDHLGRPASTTTSMSASMYGRAGGWVPRHPGHIKAGGVDKDVTFADPDPDLNDQIDAAYRDKYRRYGPNIIGGVVNPEARAATIRLVPR